MVEGNACQGAGAGSGVGVAVVGIGVAGADVGVGVAGWGVGVGSSPHADRIAASAVLMTRDRPKASCMTRTPPSRRCWPPSCTS